MIGNLKQKAASALNLDGPMATVLQTLKGSSVPQKADDLAKSTGIDKSIIDRVLQMLTQSGKVSCPDGENYSAS